MNDKGILEKHLIFNVFCVIFLAYLDLILYIAILRKITLVKNDMNC